MKRKKVIEIAISVIFIVIFLVGYSNSQSIDYFPLAVGNSWTYVGMGDTTIHRVVTEKSEMKDGGIGYKINQSNYMKGELWFKNEHLISVDKYAITKYLLPSGSSTTILKLPVKIGDKWGKDPLVQYTIEQVKQPVKVQAGEFKNCIRVTTTDISLKESDSVVLIGYTYYAPNIGEIKNGGVQINKGKASKETTVFELKEYELK